MSLDHRIISPLFAVLARAPAAQLSYVFTSIAQKPDWEALAGSEFLGWNCARWVQPKKFVKGFFHGGGQNGEYSIPLGYNIPVRRDGFLGVGYDLEKPWQLVEDDEGQPKQERFFSVQEVDRNSRDNKFLDALLLNYAAAERWTPLRDYLKQINDDLFLGKAYFAAHFPILSDVRLPVSYFVLQRFREASYAGTEILQK